MVRSLSLNAEAYRRGEITRRSYVTYEKVHWLYCWSCHRGNSKPARMPRAGWEDRLAKWPDSLKLGAADARKPAEEVYRNIQSLKGSSAGGLAMTMSVFAAALGVSLFRE